MRASTDDMKRKFLLKKGLNEAEIREAFARVKPAVQQPAPQQATPVPLQVGGGYPGLAVSQSSFSSRIRDLLNLLLLIGGASYGLRYLWKVKMVDLAMQTQLTCKLFRHTLHPGCLALPSLSQTPKQQWLRLVRQYLEVFNNFNRPSQVCR